MTKSIDETRSIVINGVPIVWKKHGLTFFGIDSIIFWTNPSLVSILKPLRNEIGEELYSLLISYEASKGTHEDYHSMVNTLGESFEEGFLNWGKAVSGAGWGRFSIVSLDWNKKEAIIRIDDPWEMKIFSAEHPQDSAPFLSGKVSGVFSHAFHTNCRAEIVEAKVREDQVPYIILRVCPSKETLEQTLSDIQKRRLISPYTEIKAVNTVLRRNQQRLLDILDNVGTFVWEADVEMNISYITSTASNILSVAHEELIGKSVLSLIHEEDVGAFQKSLSFLKTKSSLQPSFDLEVRIWTGRRKLLWVGFHVKALYDFSGNLSGYLGAGRDITTHMQLEAQLEEHRQKSVESAKMASLGEMAGGIGHELNNPLSMIITSVWQLKNALNENSFDPEEWKEKLETIDNTAQRMAKIIKAMRSFSRNAENDSFCVFSVKSIIEETLLYCRAKFANHCIELRILDVSSELEIECKPTQIGQILLNFLNNSFDAILPLTERWVELQVEEQTEVIKIQVTDSGDGVPKSIRGKLMQPFFTTKDPGKGTGLGLSISHKIAAKHHGNIYLDEESKNTRFVLTLPKRQPN